MATTTGLLLPPLLTHLLHRGAHAPGLFRTSRPVDEVRALWRDLLQLANGTAGSDETKKRELVAQRLVEDGDVHRVAAVLLHCLREQEPLVPPRLYGQVFKVDLAASDPEAVLAGCRSVLQEFTLPELKQLQALVQFLGQVAQCATELPVAGLAFIFAPLVARPLGNHGLDASMSVQHVQGFGQLRGFLAALVESCEELFQEAGDPLPEHLRAPSAPAHAPHGFPGADVATELSWSVVAEFFCRPADVHVSAGQDESVPTSWAHASSRGHGEVFLRWHPRGRGRQVLAQERRRMVQACRALRMQIKRFEDVFAHQHGHAPKGRERLPLSSTYAQYREWKRNIRDHAAGQVQALFRGFRWRHWHRRQVQQRALHGDPDAPTTAAASAAAVATRGLDRTARDGQAWAADGAPPGAKAVAEAEPGSTCDSTHQHTKRVELRGGSDQDAGGGPDHPPSGSMASWSMGELQREKKRIKAQLKAFDAEFTRKHGRMPTKSEKEPIRDLYELYHAVKVQIKHFGAKPQEQRPVQLTGKHAANAACDSTPASKTAASLSSTPAGALRDLDLEKTRLHEMLQRFEHDFERTHGRPVSTPADIAPVQTDYDRYKELKRLLSSGNNERDGHRPNRTGRNGRHGIDSTTASK